MVALAQLNREQLKPMDTQRLPVGRMRLYGGASGNGYSFGQDSVARKEIQWHARMGQKTVTPVPVANRSPSRPRRIPWRVSPAGGLHCLVRELNRKGKNTETCRSPLRTPDTTAAPLKLCRLRDTNFRISRKFHSFRIPRKTFSGPDDATNGSHSAAT